MKLIECNGVDGIKISAIPEAANHKLDILFELQQLELVTDQRTQEVAVASLRIAKKFLKDVEASRKAIKEPVLALGKKIDAFASDFASDLESKVIEIESQITAHQNYMAAMERDRQKAIMEEHLKKEAELRKQQALAANPEQKRELAEKTIELEREAMQQLEAIQPPKSQGLSMRRVAYFKVIDPIKAFSEKPEWFEIVPRTALINKAILAGEKAPEGMLAEIKEESVIRC